MSSSEWIENTCDAMIAKLVAELPAAIDTVNEEVTDGMEIEHVATDANGAPGIKLGERSDTPYPWVTVMPSRTAKDLDTGERLVYAHTIDIVSVYWDTDEEALVRKLLRFSRAVREVALDRRQPGVVLGEGGWGLEFLGDNYGRMVAEPPAFIKPVTSTFLVKQQQSI
jgi:hypothetical protein